MTEWLRKLGAWRRRKTIDAELQEEIDLHLAMKTSATGDAHAAQRQFGNTTLHLEDSRAAWGWPRPEAWLRDFRYALRMVARKPGFATTVILTLGLGIGSSSTIFSLIDTVLIRPLPFPASERLVAVHEAKASDERSRTRVAPGRLEDWQLLSSAFEAIAGSSKDTLTETSGPVPERISGARVSPRFFSVLGAPPALGRVFDSEEERFGGPLAVVISDGIWRRLFSADPGVLKRSLMLTGLRYTIVGVMSSTFQYPDSSIDVWVPRQATPHLLQIREARFYAGVGRLKPGVTLEQAQADLAAVQKRLGDEYPKTDAGWSVAVEPLKDQLVGKVRLALWLLMGSVSLLLLIACANVACLLLARLNSRNAEIATRRSLGAGRAAIARQLFTEGLVYAMGGGLLGAAATFSGIRFLRQQLTEIPRINELAADGRILAMVIAVSVLAAVIFSLAPMLQTLRRDSTVSLLRGGRHVIGSRQRLTRVLVSAQLALATALLIGAGLFLRSLLKLQEAPLGFRPENVLALRVGASFNESPDSAIQRHQRTLDALASVPGVTAVSMSSGLPGVNPAWPREFQIAGEPSPDGSMRFAAWRVITAGYFQTLGIPILDGQTCRMNSDPKNPFEALVNRTFADQYFQGRNPLGHAILLGPVGDSSTKIVGIVADAREDGHSKQAQPLIYACGYLRYWPDSDFLIQSRNPAAIASAARMAAQNLEPSRPVYSVRPLTSALTGALSQTRFRAQLISLFSIMALMLAAIGLYGVMSYMVSQRTREIGIRLALGARRGQILADILRSGGVLASAGAVAGIALAAVASRLVATLLYGVQPSDVGSYAMATAALLGVAVLACLIPGRRAISIDPTQALREQ